MTVMNARAQNDAGADYSNSFCFGVNLNAAGDINNY